LWSYAGRTIKTTKHLDERPSLNTGTTWGWAFLVSGVGKAGMETCMRLPMNISNPAQNEKSVSFIRALNPPPPHPPRSIDLLVLIARDWDTTTSKHNIAGMFY
jgi:hypothetical protein